MKKPYLPYLRYFFFLIPLGIILNFFLGNNLTSPTEFLARLGLAIVMFSCIAVGIKRFVAYSLIREKLEKEGKWRKEWS